MTRLRLLVVVCAGLTGGAVAEGCLGPDDTGVVCGVGELECGGECFLAARDPRNCGACGVVCTDGRVCQDGVCRDRCYDGLMDCGGGCTDLSTDDDHCGACGVACGPLEHCAGGTCAAGCDAGEVVCSGACTDLQTDSDNCGRCGVVCEWPMECYDGECSTADSSTSRWDRSAGYNDYPSYDGPGPGTF
ncbi:MAG: hypothetical protein JXB32_23915 [Deltaproteobacteria bacterium]|nr:hypothetical protein [Deltaproteobacteria bacterium]